MSISTQVSSDGNTITIGVSGRFDFSLHQAFRQAYEQGSPGASFELDMRSVDYMDSSALGMLLLLQEYAGSKEKVRISNCGANIKEILQIANFDQIFTME